MSVEILVCSCGMRLRTPGAVAGRVGKCPRCGSLLKVPDLVKFACIEVRRQIAMERPSFVNLRDRSSRRMPTRIALSDGLVTRPLVAETHWRRSLLYPLWNDSGLAILAFMPVGLWFATVPLFGLIPLLSQGSALGLLGLILLIPQGLLLIVVGGYTLLFLGQVLVSSALGEVVQPRSPSWSFSEIGQGVGRWFWALIVGVLLGGLPSLIYWIHCGDVDWLDRIVLIDLVIPGMAYAQMALLAALTFQSPLGANPVTVVRAIFRVGFASGSPCLITGTALMLVVTLFEGVLQIRDPLGQSVAFWAFWVMTIYASMVVLRCLGLFCYRQAVVLDWFPDRTLRLR